MTKTNKLVAATAPMADRKWQAEDALRTLTRAGEIQRDKSLMREVKKCAREQMKTLAKVTSGPNRKK